MGPGVLPQIHLEERLDLSGSASGAQTPMVGISMLQSDIFTVMSILFSKTTETDFYVFDM